MRIVPNWSGTTTAGSRRQALLNISGGRYGAARSWIQLNINATGTLEATVVGKYGNQRVGVTTTTQFNPTSGQANDLMFSWDGTTGTGKFKISIDGVEAGALTPFSANDFDGALVAEIAVGTAYDMAFCDFKLNELLIFDSAENHVYSARTDFYACNAFDGQSNTGAGAANIRSGTTEVIAGVTFTGTAAIPTAANVRAGTATDATTGTLAVPVAANVRYGTSVDATTGTARIPTAADVRSGTLTDATTGTLIVPVASSVRLGVSVDATTGTAVIPGAPDVRLGVSVDATTGTLDLPAEASVKTGVQFDGASKTGTYDGSDRHTDPGVANVRLGTTYKSNSTGANRTGTAAIPTAANVRFGTATDATTGTLDLPDIGDVSLGVTYDNGTKTGTRDAVTNVMTELTLTGATTSATLEA